MASATQNLTNAPTVMLKMKGVGSHFGSDSEFIKSVHRTVNTIATSSNALMDGQKVNEVLNQKATQRYGILINKIM